MNVTQELSAHFACLFSSLSLLLNSKMKLEPKSMYMYVGFESVEQNPLFGFRLSVWFFTIKRVQQSHSGRWFTQFHSIVLENLTLTRL